MTPDTIQHCPQCGGAVNREDVAVLHTETDERRFLYCEYCQRGWEILITRDSGDVIPQTYGARELRKYTRRLMLAIREARAAADRARAALAA